MSTTPRITSIATPVVTVDGSTATATPRNMEVSELQIKTLRVNMSNGLITVEGDKGVLDPAPNRVPRANALGVIDAGWIPESMVRTTDTRLSDTRVPKTHASTHRHGGSDEIATTTVDAYAIPKANAAGQLDINWMPDSTTHITVPWTLAAAIAVNDLVPTPRAYIVGKNEFVLYKNGVAVAASEYEEVGPAGEYSTLIRAKFTAASGDKLMLYGPFSLRPMLVIDPSQGVIDPRLVCTRAGATYVTGQDGKIAEVAANTVPIDWSTGKGRIACFGQRTRLNPNYKTKGSYVSAPSSRGVSITDVSDALSPTGSAIRLLYTAANNTEGSPNPYFSVLFSAFVPQVGVDADTAYTVSVCVRASRQIESLIDLKKDNNIPTNNKTITISTEYKVFSITTVIPAGSFLYSFAMSLNKLNDGEYLDVAWYQAEQSPCATPLIAGPEGQQVTVSGQFIRVADKDFEKTDEHFDSLTVFSEISALENSKMMKRSVAYIGTLSVSSFFEPYLKGPAPFKYELVCRKDAETTIVTLPQTTPMASKACFRLSDGKMTVATKEQYSDKLLAGAMPISKERLFVGSRAIVNDYILDGYIHKLLIWPIALPDAQLKALTAE